MSVCQASRRFIGIAYLTLDLNLSQHHRIETGDHAEEVADYIFFASNVKEAFRRFRKLARLARQHLLGMRNALLGFQKVEVKLSSVARRNQCRFSDPWLVEQAPESVGRLRGVEREALADFHRRRSMTEAHYCEGHDPTSNPNLGTKTATIIKATGPPLYPKGRSGFRGPSTWPRSTRRALAQSQPRSRAPPPGSFADR